MIFTRPPVAKCSMLKSGAEVRQEEGFETETKDKEDFGLGEKKGRDGRGDGDGVRLRMA